MEWPIKKPKLPKGQTRMPGVGKKKKAVTTPNKVVTPADPYYINSLYYTPSKYPDTTSTQGYHLRFPLGKTVIMHTDPTQESWESWNKN